jgi:MoaA/NifB/PqqE/SkfB family radical SAM enzyme
MANFYIRNSWVSSRTFSDQRGSFSAISNSKTHEFITLEDEAAQIWRFLELGIEYNDLKNYAKSIDAEVTLDEFLIDLKDLELISSHSHEITREKLSILNNSLKITGNSVPTPLKLADVSDDDLKYGEIESAIQDRAIAAGSLWSFFWEVTYRCNEKCVHCFNPGASHSPGEQANRNTNELTRSEIVTMLDELVEIGVFRLILSGGEVFVHKDFFFIMSEAHKRGFQIHVYTNGLLLSESRIDKLAEYWPDTVSISIYSENSSLHDEITRVKKSYDKSISALNRLTDRGIRTTIKSPMMKSTADKWEKIQKLADDNGSRMSFDSMISAGNDGKLSPIMLNMELKQVIELAATPGSPIFVGDKSTNFGRQKKSLKSAVCGAGVSIMSITPDGGITPCCALPLNVGSIRVDGIKSIWLERNKITPEPSIRPRLTNKRNVGNDWSPINFIRSGQSITDSIADYNYPKTLSEWRSIKLENYEECGTHDRCAWCNKCPGAALNETGNVLAASSVQCQIAHGRMESAKMLERGFTLSDVKEFCDSIQ